LFGVIARDNMRRPAAATRLADSYNPFIV
jgi:hypothetical protein